MLGSNGGDLDMVVVGGGIMEGVESIVGICLLGCGIVEVGGRGDVIPCMCWFWINADCFLCTRVSIAAALFLAIRCFWYGVSGASVEGGVFLSRVKGTSVEGGYEAGMAVAVRDC